MDSALDLKFKKLMSEYFKEKKYSPTYLSKTSKPFLFKKRNLKKPRTYIIFPSNNGNDNNNIPQKTNSSSNIVFIKLKSAIKKDNKKVIKLNSFKPTYNSVITVDKNTNYRFLERGKKLVSSDILQDKTFSKLGSGQLSINSLVTQVMENKNKNRKNIYMKKNISDFELNKLHNLQLTPLKEIKLSTKMTKFAMLNNLYHKYSSTSSGCVKNKNNEDIYSDRYYKQGNKTDFLFKDNSQVYLTNYNPKKNFNFNNIYKRNLNLPENQKANNNIINKDNKIYIDCLLSKAGSDINAKKIFPKNNGKTVCNIQKENSYVRIQNLEKVFSEIMKK